MSLRPAHNKKNLNNPKHIEKFFSNVSVVRDCWEWAGSRDDCNYGTLKFSGIAYKAHRLAWLVSHGPIPGGVCVCHRCDNPPCINPKHLFLGTHQENMTDRNTKNRTARMVGSCNPRAQITESDVRLIRFFYVKGIEHSAIFARIFGVSKHIIKDVQYRRSWKHI